MKIGFDVDGVLADFSTAFVQQYLRVTGKNLFQPGDAEDAPCWNGDLYRGYTKEEASQVWAAVIASPDFWLNLPALSGADTVAMVIADLERRHDIYFVTSRVGETAKKQTEKWLYHMLGTPKPTVLISSQKGFCAAALKLDVYIDDNYHNVLDVGTLTYEERRNKPKPRWPVTRVYLLDKRYNRVGGPELPADSTPALPPNVTRVRSVGQALDYENIAGNL